MKFLKLMAIIAEFVTKATSGTNLATCFYGRK